MATSQIKQGKILTVSDRGQITIPKEFRKLMNVAYVRCQIDGHGNIFLSPLKTREDFFAELEETKKDWEKHGGYSLEEVMKASHKLS